MLPDCLCREIEENMPVAPVFTPDRLYPYRTQQGKNEQNKTIVIKRLPEVAMYEA